jgi:hypothetical protein
VSISNSLLTVSVYHQEPIQTDCSVPAYRQLKSQTTVLDATHSNRSLALVSYQFVDALDTTASWTFMQVSQVKVKLLTQVLVLVLASPLLLNVGQD